MRKLALLSLLVLASTALADPPWRYMSKEEEAKVRASLPKTQDTRLKEILTSPDLIFYDERTMPGIFQDGTEKQSNGFAGTEYTDHVRLVYTGRNISMEKHREHAGTPNNEEPWKSTAGLPEGFPTVKAILLPASGTIDIHRGREARPESMRMADMVQWKFPRGTVFVEILYQKFSDGEQLPFEIRTRAKSEDSKGAQAWSANLYRPVRNEQELSDALQLPRRESVTAEAYDLPTRHPRFFKPVRSLMVQLPRLPLKTSKYILQETEFKSALGEPWLVKDGMDCGMATTTEPDSIVPPKYNGAFFTASKATCINCHQDTQRHAYDIENPRPWYGFIRGDDGIISWHPFRPGVQDYAAGSDNIDPRLTSSGRVTYRR